MIIFSGSSNRGLAAKLARRLNIRLGKVELSRFANGETRVYVPESFTDDKAIVLQSLSNPTNDHLVEFVLLCDAVRRKGANQITAIIPWLGYSKQDKVFREGEPVSVKVIAKMLQVVPLDRIVTFDLHNAAILGFFDVPVVNLSVRTLFIDHFNKLNKNRLIVVAPDAGAIKNSTAFAQELGVPVTYIDKERNLANGKVTIRGISRKVDGLDVVMIDDMIVTGSTMIESAKYLKEQGCGKICVAATHHLFLPGVQQQIMKFIDNMIITDTIVAPKKERLVRTRILSCVDLLAKSIK